MTTLFTPSVVTNVAPQKILGPDPTGPRFRGDWAHARHDADGPRDRDHRHRFSRAESFDNDYHFIPLDTTATATGSLPTGGTESTHDRATTRVDNEGYTAIRVNLPPIGLNKARISIQIDNSAKLDLIDLEVPAVVVIDPGHGGVDTGNSLETVTPKLHERDLTLAYATEIKKTLRRSMQEQERHSKVVVGKQATDNGKKYPNEDRAAQARQQGADIDLALHFNGGGATSTGTQVYLLGVSENNVNYVQDKSLANRMYAAGEAVFGAGDRAEDQQIIDLGAGANGRVFIRDTYLGNVAGAGRESTYIRAVILELEHLSQAGVANRLTGKNATNTRQSYASEAARSITNDILVQP